MFELEDFLANGQKSLKQQVIFLVARPDTDEGPWVVAVDVVTPPVLSVSLNTVEAPGALATLPGQSQVPTTFRRSRKMKYRGFDIFWRRLFDGFGPVPFLLGQIVQLEASLFGGFSPDEQHFVVGVSVVLRQQLR